MTPDSRPCVFVVDDDPSVRRAIHRMLEAAGMRVEAFASAKEFLDAHDGLAEGCLLLDVKMPEMNGLELQEVLAAHACDLPIVFLTGHGDVPMSVRAMKHGAADFLMKPVDSSLLISALERALEVGRRRRRARDARASVEQRLRSLTIREREVLSFLLDGLLNKQIAAALGTVEKTIKVHRARVMQKMEVKSIAALVRMCEQAGVVPASRRIPPGEDG